MDSCKKRKVKSLLEIAIIMEGGFKATVQLFNRVSQELTMVAHTGFKPEFLEYFRSVKPFDPSPGGRAMGVQNMVIIRDIEKEIECPRHCRIAMHEGYKAIKAVPVISGSRLCQGILSIYYTQVIKEKDRHKLHMVLPELAELLEKWDT